MMKMKMKHDADNDNDIAFVLFNMIHTVRLELAVIIISFHSYDI